MRVHQRFPNDDLMALLRAEVGEPFPDLKHRHARHLLRVDLECAIERPHLEESSRGLRGWKSADEIEVPEPRFDNSRSDPSAIHWRSAPSQCCAAAADRLSSAA